LSYSREDLISLRAFPLDSLFCGSTTPGRKRAL
jgi:hypothetical protein